MTRLPQHLTVLIRERLLNRSRNKDRELVPAERIQLRIKSMNEQRGRSYRKARNVERNVNTLVTWILNKHHMKVRTKYKFTVSELWLVMVINYMWLHTTREFISMHISNELWNKIPKKLEGSPRNQKPSINEKFYDVDNAERDGGGT